jgi:hypothetical protein
MSAPAEFQAGLDDAALGLTARQSAMAALVARQRAQRLAAGIAAEARHQMDPAEGPIEEAFARLACECDDPCACEGDQP